MKYNRILAMCLAAALLLSLAACTKKQTPAPSPTAAAGTTPEATTPPIHTTIPTTPMVTVPLDTSPLVPQDRIAGSYEQWLAAAAVLGVFTQYPTAQIQGIYALSTTDFDKKMDSKGIAIHLLVGDTQVWLKSVPLKAERTASGQRNLYALGLGYNTFDRVDPVKVTGAKELTIDSLQPYIELTVLPTVSVNP